MRLFRQPDSSVLMVCTANVCRSPMAEGLLRLELRKLGQHRRIAVDSAGTHVSQSGRPADPRAQTVCTPAGIDLRRCRARQVRERDFNRFDHILAMDRRNLEWLLNHCPEDLTGRISLLGSWAGEGEMNEIPDPYFGNLAGFEAVLAMLRRGVEGLLPRLLP